MLFSDLVKFLSENKSRLLILFGQLAFLTEAFLQEGELQGFTGEANAGAIKRFSKMFALRQNNAEGKMKFRTGEARTRHFIKHHFREVFVFFILFF